MKTSQTSSPFTAILEGRSGDVMMAACVDEFQKIAEEALQVPEQKKVTFPRWMKNTAIIGAGVGTGTAVGMVTEKALMHFGGPLWHSLSPTTKRMVLGPAIAGAGIGTALAGDWMMRKRVEADNG